jgi:GxxExxY protein
MELAAKKRRRRKTLRSMKDPVFQLCDRVREASFSLHRHLRHGHVEKVYENGLAHRLRKQGLHAVQQQPLNVLDEDGTLLGEFFADLFVEHQLVVELKAVRCLADEHVAQLLGYLRASRLEHGLLVNFGTPVLEISKFVLSDTV